MRALLAVPSIFVLAGVIAWAEIILHGGRTPWHWWYDRRWLRKIRKTCTHPAWCVDDQIRFRWVRPRRSSSAASAGERPFS